MAQYFKVIKADNPFPRKVMSSNGQYAYTETEKERGVDGICEVTGKEHNYLLLPEWSDSVKTGGKEYVMCLDCLEFTHL